MKKMILTVIGSLMLAISASSLAQSHCQSDMDMWVTFKNSFINANGRVIDNGNQNISHSESQGYGMLIAEYFEDKVTFDRIWRWTKANLQRKDDNLFSWKWQLKKPHIPDRNNASDGDILIAWALLRADKQWPNQGYDSRARNIILELQATHIKMAGEDKILLPGSYGFSFKDRIIINPAYWVYPALNDFSRYSQQWSILSRSGLSILSKTLDDRHKLVPEWLEYRSGRWKPASDFGSTFGYSNYRIPLYIVWAGKSHAINKNFIKWLDNESAWVDIRSGEKANYPPPDGAMAIAQLVESANCSPNDRKGISVMPKGKDYYSDSLVLLSHIAYNERICQ